MVVERRGGVKRMDSMTQLILFIGGSCEAMQVV